MELYSAFILLPMQIDPMAEWQRITKVYRGMYDDELINLVADKEDLTDVARQVLDLELKKRGLGDLSNASAAREAPEIRHERRAALIGNQGGASQIVLDHRARMNEAPLEYSWKTPLCECESMEQAQQLTENLKLAGIDSWIDEPNAASRFNGLQNPNPRVLVAADQLEQAREVAANPIPKEIIEDLKFVGPEFDMPKCPHCGVPDPALEGVNPFNSWRCEGCGCQWTESEVGEVVDPAEEGKGAQ
jgi:hypothetical protein